MPSLHAVPPTTASSDVFNLAMVVVAGSSPADGAKCRVGDAVPLR